MARRSSGKQRGPSSRPGPRRRFRAWRRRRPFWGGLLTMLAGAEICVLPLAPVSVMIAQGIAGVPSVLMGVFLIALGMITWASPQQHTITGVLTTLIGLGALVMSNLGGFVIGSLLAFVGGGLMFAWRPTARPRSSRRGRRSARRSQDGGGPPAPAAPGSGPTAEEALDRPH
ncbi:DUF6114 domain-containing protein [Marinactinospora thermotolerans]|uniref:Integral membrane protein n=1 Tax=Marinactinospora thermotolerans DSM 45154 TaxID=1122192 RepID=A0A1T4REH5_9ACTN|nr:DUF6114 domain-containing protein [Marinactinospora thermotolerans]SKA14430.1 hypothetical protein SAMN02745673_02757 [Marinactinospora thermotolerans DSM 45154]